MTETMNTGEGDTATKEEEMSTETSEIENTESLKGKRVKFDLDENTPMKGRVLKHSKKGDKLDVKADDGETYQMGTADVTVLKEKSAKEDDETGGEIESTDDAPKSKKGKKKDDGIARYVPRLVKLEDIEIPDEKVREVNEADFDDPNSKLAQMLKNIKRDGLIEPVKGSGEWEKPVLWDGGHRVAIFKKLGATEIPLVLAPEPMSSEDRLYSGLMANTMRQEMNWVDTARTIKRLAESSVEKYSQKRLGGAFRMNETKVSRLLASLELPEEILAHASNPRYSQSVFLEMAGMPEKQIAQVQEFMDADRPLTQVDVRALRKEAESEGESTEGKPPKKGQKGSKGGGSATFQNLSHKDTGPRINIRVGISDVSVTIGLDWKAKTFTKLDMVAEITKAFEEAFADEEICASRSFEMLNKAMTSAKSGLLKSDTAE